MSGRMPSDRVQYALVRDAEMTPEFLCTHRTVQQHRRETFHGRRLDVVSLSSREPLLIAEMTHHVVRLRHETRECDIEIPASRQLICNGDDAIHVCHQLRWAHRRQASAQLRFR